MDIEREFNAAVQYYWDSRTSQSEKSQAKGTLNVGARAAVTGGGQMRDLEKLVVRILAAAGIEEMDIRTGTSLELPGYYRPEKKWDLLVVSKGSLVTALEFKSQVGPSFGNNFNNRTEEAIGNAVDIWTAYREGLLGTGPRPFLGYFFLLEDCERVHVHVRPAEPYFKVDVAFKDASYAKRYELLLRRLVLERQYDAACLTLATNGRPTRVSHPSDDLAFRRFVGELQACATRFLSS